MSAEDNARKLGLDLSKGATPLANYVPAVRSGNLIFLSGHVPPPDASGTRPAGKVGADFDVDAAYSWRARWRWLCSPACAPRSATWTRCVAS